jgi:predicted O-methyltransferase YrrM
MAAKPLQHQDELSTFLDWTQQIDPPLAFGTIVEIGTHRGGTMELWGRLATHRFVTIDLPDGFGGGLSLAAMTARDDDFAQRFPHLRSIRGDSHSPATVAQLREHLGSSPIDLLFIDGDHTYSGVQQDVEAYAPLVRPGGVVALHDVTCAPARCLVDRVDVPQYWADLSVPDKQVFSVHAEWGGIGAWVVRTASQ